MQQGEFLVDHERGEERFRIRGRFATGVDHQIALVEDTEHDDRFCCARVVMYDPERADDPEYVEQRRDLLCTQRELLEQGYDGLPELVDWLEVETEDGLEPVLVYEYIHGTNAYEYVTRERHTGMEPAPATVTARKVGQTVARLHQNGWVWRNFDPRHVIVDEEGDFVGLVGFGNAAPLEDHRPNPTLLESYAEAPYVAPEVRNERSGEMLRPQADVYGIGALLSFLLTQQEPTTRVESPLKGPAYDRLMEMEPPGVALLVAMCLQPTAKHRLDDLERFLVYTMPAQLPSPETSEYALSDMPQPWSGAEPPQLSRAMESKLSAGPLISVPGDGEKRGKGGTGGNGEKSGAKRATEPSSAEPASSGEQDVDGVMSDPVREFMGEGGATPEGPEDVPAIEENDDAEVARGEGGEPVKEVSMVGDVERRVEEAEEAASEKELEEARSKDTEETDEEAGRAWEASENRVMPEPSDKLPPFEELPRKWRIIIGLVIPAIGAIAVAVLIGMGVI